MSIDKILVKRLAIASIPSLLLLAIASIDSLYELVDFGPTETPLVVYLSLAVGACVLAPFVAARPYRWLRVTGLVVAPVFVAQLGYAHSNVAALVEILMPGQTPYTSLPFSISAGVLAAAWVLALAILVKTVAPLKTTRHFWRCVGVVALFAGVALFSGIQWFCWFDCSTADRVIARVSEIAVLLVPVLLAAALHFGSARENKKATRESGLNR